VLRGKEEVKASLRKDLTRIQNRQKGESEDTTTGLRRWKG